MSRILITGVNGFVGRNLVDMWHTSHRILGIDLPPQLFSISTLEPYTEWMDQAYHYDLRTQAHIIHDHLHNSDIVVHCAARTRINPSWQDYSDYYDTNVTASHKLFEACQRSNIKKFIYFSSSSVYGNAETMSETTALNPTNPYAVSKAAAEMALRVQAQKGNTELIIVRPFTMYGKYMNFGSDALAIAKFINAANKDEPLMLDAGGTQHRDYICVEDAVRALDLIIEHGSNGDVYNIGTGETVSIKEIADCISYRQIVGPPRLGHIERTCADITRLRQLGFEPKIKLIPWLTNYIKQLKLENKLKE